MSVLQGQSKLIVTNTKTGDSVKADLVGMYGCNHLPMHRVKALLVKHLRGRQWVRDNEQRIKK